MKYSTQTVREGEYLGPIDWTFDFEGFGKKYNMHPDRVKAATERLRSLKVGDMATTDGGWPRIGWHPVIQIGMYDGWPFWYPVPSVMMSGAEWHPWYSISDVEPSPVKKESASA